MSCPICSYLKPNGVRCGSPAQHGHNYCYFHTREHRTAMYGARARRRYSTVRFDLPPLDDMNVIQDLLSQVAGALASDTITGGPPRCSPPCAWPPSSFATRRSGENTAMQLFANEYFTCKSLTASILRGNSPYPYENEEF